MLMLAVIGIAETGEPEVLAFRVGDRENEQIWKDLLEDLKQCSVKEIGLWISDGNQAMLNAITAKFGTVPRKRRVVHKMDNVRALFYQKDCQAADQAVAAFIEKYRFVYPSAIECLRCDLEVCLTFYSFPKEHWKTIRTNTVMKRRSHTMAAAFRNEGSCLLLFHAVIRSLKFDKLTMPVPTQAQPEPALLHNT